MNTPLKHCPFCQCGRFVSVPDARIELSVQGTNTRATDLRGAVAVCTGCGRVEFFVPQPEAWLAKMLDENRRSFREPLPSVVTVGPGAPPTR